MKQLMYNVKGDMIRHYKQVIQKKKEISFKISLRVGSFSWGHKRGKGGERGTYRWGGGQ